MRLDYIMGESADVHRNSSAALGSSASHAAKDVPATSGPDVGRGGDDVSKSWVPGNAARLSPLHPGARTPGGRLGQQFVDPWLLYPGMVGVVAAFRGNRV